jgi:hypothetical protein
MNLIASSTKHIVMAAFVLSLTSASAQAAERYDLKDATQYSNFCTERESGDIAGVGVFVRRSDQQPRVVVAFTEGAIMEPIPARARSTGGRLTFTLHGPTAAESLTGQLRGQHMVVRSLEPNAKSQRLRRTDRAAVIPNCNG